MTLHVAPGDGFYLAHRGQWYGFFIVWIFIWRLVWFVVVCYLLFTFQILIWLLWILGFFGTFSMLHFMLPYSQFQIMNKIYILIQRGIFTDYMQTLCLRINVDLLGLVLKYLLSFCWYFYHDNPTVWPFGLKLSLAKLGFTLIQWQGSYKNVNSQNT